MSQSLETSHLQAVVGQRPGEQHLHPVPGLGQSARPADPLQCRVCPHRGSPGHRVGHPRDEGHPEGSRVEGVFNIQVSSIHPITNTDYHFNMFCAGQPSPLPSYLTSAGPA